MLETLLGVGLLALAGCMVVLFAMMGELAARLPAADETPWVRAIEDALQDRAPSSWPPELEGLRHGRAALLVLSTVCESCRAVAAQLPQYALDEGLRLGLVVSTGNRDSGEAFLQEFNLRSIPHFLDIGGEWTTTELGVRISPAGILVEDGTVREAATFSAFTAWWQRVADASGNRDKEIEVSRP